MQTTCCASCLVFLRLETKDTSGTLPTWLVSNPYRLCLESERPASSIYERIERSPRSRRYHEVGRVHLRLSRLCAQTGGGRDHELGRLLRRLRGAIHALRPVSVDFFGAVGQVGGRSGLLCSCAAVACERRLLRQHGRSVLFRPSAGRLTNKGCDLDRARTDCADPSSCYCVASVPGRLLPNPMVRLPPPQGPRKASSHGSRSSAPAQRRVGSPTGFADGDVRNSSVVCKELGHLHGRPARAGLQLLDYPRALRVNMTWPFSPLRRYKNNLSKRLSDWMPL